MRALLELIYPAFASMSVSAWRYPGAFLGTLVLATLAAGFAWWACGLWAKGWNPIYRPTLGHHVRAFGAAFLTFWMVVLFASLKHVGEVPEGLTESASQARLVAAVVYLALLVFPLWRIAVKAHSQRDA